MCYLLYLNISLFIKPRLSFDCFWVLLLMALFLLGQSNHKNNINANILNNSEWIFSQNILYSSLGLSRFFSSIKNMFGYLFRIFFILRLSGILSFTIHLNTVPGPWFNLFLVPNSNYYFFIFNKSPFTKYLSCLCFD